MYCSDDDLAMVDVYQLFTVYVNIGNYLMRRRLGWEGFGGRSLCKVFVLFENLFYLSYQIEKERKEEVRTKTQWHISRAKAPSAKASGKEL